MFELIDFKSEHAIEIYKNGIRPPNTKYFDKNNTSWADGLAQHPAKTAVYDGRIVACGGLVVLYEKHRAEAWLLAVKGIGQLHIDPKIARDLLYNWIVDNDIKRTEAPLRADFAAGFSYAKWIGFKFEAILENYHPDGVDAHMHVIIRKDS